MPRKAMKAAHSDPLVIYGGIDCQGVVPVGAPDEVRAVPRDAIRMLGARGGLIIGLTHTLTSETPLENVWTLWGAVREERGKLA